MEFEFIRELSEARLFRNPSNLGGTTASFGNIADSFFNALMGLKILKHTNPKAAADYANRTLSGNINDWRSSGSDLHNMAHILSDPRRYSDKLRMDRVVSLPEMQYNQFLRNVSQGKDDPNFDRQFFMRLQQGLKISSGGLQSARRLISDWDRAYPDEKKLAATRVYLGLQNELKNSDMWPILSKNMEKKHLIMKDASVEKTGMPLWQKMAIAGVAGYMIGKKMMSL